MPWIDRDPTRDGRDRSKPESRNSKFETRTSSPDSQKIETRQAKQEFVVLVIGDLIIVSDFAWRAEAAREGRCFGFRI